MFSFETVILYRKTYTCIYKITMQYVPCWSFVNMCSLWWSCVKLRNGFHQSLQKILVFNSISSLKLLTSELICCGNCIYCMCLVFVHKCVFICSILHLFNWYICIFVRVLLYWLLYSIVHFRNIQLFYLNLKLTWILRSVWSPLY